LAKAIEKDSGHRVTHGEVGRRPAGHPVLLQYVLAREGNQGPVLFSLPLDFDEEALAVFSSGRTAQSPALSSVLTQEWRTRICSAGELASWLLGPYACIEWVLLDPLLGCLGAGNSLANLTPREEFLDYLLGQAVGKHGRSEESHDDR
jgi:hypothetical protein